MVRFEDTYLGRNLHYTQLAESIMTEDEKRISREREDKLSEQETYEFLRAHRQAKADARKIRIIARGVA